MRIEVDLEVDNAYIQIAPDIGEGEVAKTYLCDPREVGGMINLDFDINGRLLGIEVLGASHLLPLEVLEDNS
jgi:uncharacterized protein YuzE